MPYYQTMGQDAEMVPASERDARMIAAQPEQYRSASYDYRDYLAGIDSPRGPSFADLGWRDKEKIMQMGAPINLKPGDLERMGSQDIERYVKPWFVRQKDPAVAQAWLSGSQREAQYAADLKRKAEISGYYKDPAEFQRRFGGELPKSFVSPTVTGREQFEAAEQEKRKAARERYVQAVTPKGYLYNEQTGQFDKIEGYTDEKGEQSKWRIEDTMNRQYEAQIKPYVTELDAINKIKGITPDLVNRRPNAVEQQSLIILLNKFLDPQSVVREGEFNRVAKAQGLIDKALNFKQKILRGEILGDKIIADIVELAKFYENASQEKINTYGDAYYEKAQKRGLDVNAVITNPNYVPKSQRGKPKGKLSSDERDAILKALKEKLGGKVR
jgi:hypothetical protein